MNKLSYWINISNSIFMLVLVIIGIVKVSTTSGKFDLTGYSDYQSEVIWNSIFFKIALTILGISFLIIVISYIIQGEILEKILMIASLIIPIVLVSILFSILRKQESVNEVFAVISCCTCLLPFLNLLINEEFRYKFLFLLFSGAWVGFGIYFIYFLVILIVAVALFFVISKILSLFLDTPDPEYIYDKAGNVIGQIIRYK